MDISHALEIADESLSFSITDMALHFLAAEVRCRTLDNGAPSVKDARRMGKEGSAPVENERLAFEAWMAGHCWSLEDAVWNGSGYRGNGETLSHVSLSAMGIRRMWAAWRDRAALVRLNPLNAAGTALLRAKSGTSDNESNFTT